MDKPERSEKWRLLRTYATLSRGGRKAFKVGEVQTAPKDDERAEKNFFLSAAFTEESEEKVKQICNRIDAIGKKHDIPLVLAGRDYRIHATLQGGVLPADDIEARKHAYGEIYFDDELLKQKEILVGKSIDFRFVVTSNNSITLTAIAIPEEITKFRIRAKEVAHSQGVTIPPYPDIMHITLARPTALPDSGKEEKLKNFLHDMLALRRELSRTPISLIIDHVFTAPVKRFKK